MKQIILLISNLAINISLESKLIRKTEYLVPDCDGRLWKNKYELLKNDCSETEKITDKCIKYDSD